MTDKLKINVKVLSLEHLRYKKEKKAAKAFGARVKKAKGIYILNTPEGYPKEETSFHNQCAIVATMLGHYYNLYKEGEYPRFPLKRLKETDDRRILKIKKTAKWLEDKLFEVIRTLGLPPNGPHFLANVMPKLAGHFGIQINIFSVEQTSFLVESFPREHDPSKGKKKS